MAVNLAEPGRLKPVAGVTLAAAAANVKRSIASADESSEGVDSSVARDDLALIVLAEDSTVAGVFTQSGFAAPPVQLCRENLAVAKGNRTFMVNSGNANAATGERGMNDAITLATSVAEKLGVEPAEVLPFSTGVIGEFLPVERMIKGFGLCADSLRPDNWLQAARAIMTTDTLPKAVSKEIQMGSGSVTIREPA